VVRYLSLAWIDALSQEGRQEQRTRRALGTHKIGVTRVVTDGPEGNVTYLRLGDGTASFGAGPADAEDVCMEQSWATATAINRRPQTHGSIHQGRRLTGNQRS
jgi:hypothetical protein